ncbi:hypothetical protein CTEN210_00093 [Chaetoceros tenuissimus]|uniref:Uncharacterized protein n=1 Tax=Chaetoceros tenuissimus TaxID=426638 RepID=A0AAD3CFC4_9STRA|nr:hypothetical protein CTEN210_00093 [Chaetoceros tenuissimus]
MEELGKESLKLILSNQVQTTFDRKLNVADQKEQGSIRRAENSNNSSSNVSFLYTSTCSTTNVMRVQESTSSLYTARTLMKANRTSDAWEHLRSLFSMQGMNGYMPKYIFWNTNSEEENISNEIFYNGTSIPRYDSFVDTSLMPTNYQPCPKTSKEEVQLESKDSSSCLDFSGNNLHIDEMDISSSGRLSALPIHSTVLLEMFYLSNQTNDDLLHLHWYFERIYKMHNYWMEHVMKFCSENLYSKRYDGMRKPCYNIIHPFESLVPMSSPQWNDALSYINDIIEERGWKPSRHINISGFNLDEYTRDDSSYEAMVYLMECQTNATIARASDSNSTQRKTKGNFENMLLEHCPFAMLDISHLAVLSKSHKDLNAIAWILHESHSRNAPTKTQLLMIENWIDLTSDMLARLIWDDNSSFSSKNLQFTASGGNNASKYHYNYTGESISIYGHNAADLLIGNERLDNDNFNDNVLLPILDRKANYSFNCESHPFILPSFSCSNANENTSIFVEPIMNYWLAAGLRRNDAYGLATYIEDMTLKLFCSSTNSTYSALPATSFFPSLSCGDVQFADRFDSRSGVPLSSELCSQSNVLSASVLYNLAIQDKPFSYHASPPIQRAWVVVLLTVEIILALSIGLSCLLMSLNLMRKANQDANEDGENADLLEGEENGAVIENEDILSEHSSGDNSDQYQTFMQSFMRNFMSPS